MFRDRTDAGNQLADALEEAGVTADVVLAIPRGGLPLGRAVADRLGASLDVVIARKMGAPHNPELAMGAVAEDGSRWLNDEIVAQLDVSDARLQQAAETAQREAQEKAATYRDGPPPDVGGQRVVVVDDGVATGATMRACLAMVRADDPATLVVAVPVGATETLSELRADADAVVAVQEPVAFRAVGAYYRNFDQVSDAEAQTYLQ